MGVTVDVTVQKLLVEVYFLEKRTVMESYFPERKYRNSA